MTIGHSILIKTDAKDIFGDYLFFSVGLVLGQESENIYIIEDPDKLKSYLVHKDYLEEN